MRNRISFGFIRGIAIVLAALMFSCCGSLAEETADEIPLAKPGLLLSYFDPEDQIQYYSLTPEDQITYLYLPAHIRLQGIEIHSNLDLKETDNFHFLNSNTFQMDESIQEFELTNSNGDNYLCVVKCSDLPSVSIKLKDIDLLTIRNGSKKIKYKGNDVIFSTAEGRDHFTDMTIKGRGNFTWTLPKPSYQIKIPEKTALFGMDSSDTWLLISNFLDDTMLRNRIALDMSSQMGIKYALDSRSADLWVNGEYIGNYLLTEKVHIAENRVELSDRQGVLVELDNMYHEDEENCLKSKNKEYYYVLKDSVVDDLPKEGEDKESEALKGFTFFVEAMDKLDESLGKKLNWDNISSQIDVDSFVRMYLLQEFAENSDVCRTSVFFYKDGKQDLIHMGPPWDYDISLGNFTTKERGGDPETDYACNINHFVDRSCNIFTQLMEYPEFRQEVEECYQTIYKPILQNLISQLDQYEKDISFSANLDHKRWTQSLKDLYLIPHVRFQIYEEEVNYLRNWLEMRIAFFERRYNDDFVMNGIAQVEDSENIVH